MLPSNAVAVFITCPPTICVRTTLARTQASVWIRALVGRLALCEPWPPDVDHLRMALLELCDAKEVK